MVPAYLTAAETTYALPVVKDDMVFLLRMHSDCIYRTYSDAFHTAGTVSVYKYRSSLNSSYTFEPVEYKTIQGVF